MARINPTKTGLTKAVADELNKMFGDSASSVLPLFHVGLVTPETFRGLVHLSDSGPVPMSELIARHRKRMAERIRAVNRSARGR